ncbi:MAG: hypothetical protein JWN67_3754 [Actinomycetia bacterium]|nr:hypothetical protein [Actinomycetes bacterium]
MLAARRRRSDLTSLASGGAIQLTTLVALVGTALAFWRALADPFQVTKLTILVLTALVALVLLVLRRAGNGWIGLPPRAVLGALGFFVVALVVAVATSSKPVVSFVGNYGVYAGLLTYVSAIVLGLAAASAYDDDGAERFLGVTTVVAVLAGLYALLQWAGADPFTWLRETTVFATFGNANFAAGWLAAALPLVTGWAWLHRDDRGRAVVGGVAVVVVGLAILGTRSFQGIPAGTAGMLVLLAILAAPHRHTLGAWRRELSSQARAAVTAGIAAVLAALVGVAIVLPHGISQGLVERKFFWRAALDVFREHPLVGSGLDTFGNEWYPHRAAEHSIRYASSSAEATHSVPLSMLSGGGLLLAVAYLLVVVTIGVVLLRGVVRLTGRRRVLGAALVGAWVAVQVQSTVSIDVPSLVAIQWIVAGVALAVVTPTEWRVRLGAAVPVADKKGRVRQEPWRPLSPVRVGILVVVALVAGWQALRPVRADWAVANAVHEAKRTDDEARITKTVRELRTARSLAPWVGTYQLATASFLQSIGNPPEAATYAARAAELEPGQPQYALAAAGLYASLNDLDRARSWYRRAEDADPNGVETLRAVARGYNDVKVPTRAEAVAQRLLRLDPRSAPGWFELGRAQFLREHGAAADRSFAKAVELDPTLEPQVKALTSPGSLPPT